jgi:uncharacterized protein
MKAAIERIGGPFSLFGGEPLLVAEADLEELWSWGFERYHENSVQTNGVLINSNHIEMFKRYKVGVGISIDGPGPLNDVRWAGSLKATRVATEKTLGAIERLCDEGIVPSIIITLHRGNAVAERLVMLGDWVRYLDKRGIRSVRLHALETEDAMIRESYALEAEESLAAMLYFSDLEAKLTGLRFDVFADIRSMLLGEDQRTTCVWNACDPYTTRAVQGVEGDGQRTNCGRTNKDGIDFVKSDHEGFERYLALYNTPMEFGGCQGCRFFLQCKGQCPGTAIDNDWRNRTQDCSLWMELLSVEERRLVDSGKLPLSLRDDRTRIEQHVVAKWANGEACYLYQAIRDVVDPVSSKKGVIGTHGDVPHGDSHGDAHGDHMDEGMLEV